MLILGIESSCDESAAAVVKDGREVISNYLHSQIEDHKDWGGVIPEFASRLHYKKINKVIERTLTDVKLSLSDIDAIAVTHGPGLIGSLLVGMNVAKTLAWVHNKPLIPVNHLMGHICANFLDSDIEPPFICLLASGGHTQIIQVNNYNDMGIIGETIDDAAGEAFDKVARLLDLPYPGGPELDKLAQEFNFKESVYKGKYKFPIPKVKELKFSFSGLKTSVLRLKEKLDESEWQENKTEIAFAFQDCVAQVLKRKIESALENSDINQVIIAGGVAANSRIRKIFNEINIKIVMPDLKYCTDNAAMIASAGHYKYLSSSDKEIYYNYDFEAFSKLTTSSLG